MSCFSLLNPRTETLHVECEGLVEGLLVLETMHQLQHVVIELHGSSIVLNSCCCVKIIINDIPKSS